MTIEEQKTELIKLLVSAYKARKVRGVFLIGDDGNFERIVISQSVLLKYGFDVNEEDFWEIICPLLKEEGFLREVPDRYFIGLSERLFENHVTYRKLKEEWSKLDSQLPPNYSFAKAVSGKTTEEFLSSVVMLGIEKERVRELENEIEKTEQSLRRIEEQAMQDYTFIVNSKNLLLSDGEKIFKLSPESPTKFDVFVSHASEDKDFVSVLVAAFKEAGIKVWYDNSEIQWGDDLRSTIDKGLANSSFGVVVFSKAFLEKKKWTEHELNGLFARENLKEKIILPIWHNITRDDILKYGPTFADRLAKRSDKDSTEDIVRELKKLLGK